LKSTAQTSSNSHSCNYVEPERRKSTAILHAPDYNRRMNHEHETWWVASLGDTIVWARLQVLKSGVAEVLDAAGEILRYDGEDSARTALLDAEFREWDGLDEDDAALMGFDLDSTAPPEAETDEELLPLMTEKLLRMM
jgi:hypothetical protein